MPEELWSGPRMSYIAVFESPGLSGPGSLLWPSWEVESVVWCMGNDGSLAWIGCGLEVHSPTNPLPSPHSSLVLQWITHSRDGWLQAGGNPRIPEIQEHIRTILQQVPLCLLFCCGRRHSLQTISE